ncbi:MAG: DMT family transporter [Pirellulaceae bacterium]
MSDIPIHLLLPLLASILFTLGLIATKRAGSRGASTWMIIFVGNTASATLFTGFWFTESRSVPWSLIWQPLLVGVLYILGISLTYMALDRGDVSVATPILSSKLVWVAILLTVIAGERLSATRWSAVLMAMLGIIMVQQTDRRGEHRRLVLTIVFALSAASTFAMFDVLVQEWAESWGSGHFLPIIFWTGWVLSLALLPKIDHSAWKRPGLLLPLWIGAFLVSLQAMCLVCTLAYFGDATRVNIVYALRGLWGVLFAFALARRFDMQERHASSRTLTCRIIGAILLTGAVVLALRN